MVVGPFGPESSGEVRCRLVGPRRPARIGVVFGFRGNRLVGSVFRQLGLVVLDGKL